MRIPKLALALLALLLAAPSLAEDGFKVVANPDVSVESMTRTDLSDVFLKRTTAWPGGARIEPVDQPEGAPAFEAFCKAVHHKSGAVIKAFWKRVGLSGRDTAPVTKPRDEDVLAYVRATRGAIGYVSAGAATAGVKVIAVAGE